MPREPGRLWGAIAIVAAIVCGVLVMPSATSLLLYVAIAVVYLSPGWPLARWLAGDAAGGLTRTLLAVPLGYATSGLTFVVLRFAGVVHPLVILAVAAGVAFGLRWLVRRPQPGLVPIVALTRHDAVAVAILALLALAIVGPVFARVGTPTDQGLAYRAYFNADLFVHMTVVAELIKGAAPPLNPFLPSESFPYYWTYFTLPSLFASLQPELAVDRGILLTDIVVAMAFMGVAFVTVRNFGASTLAATLAWATILLASSFEGAAYLWMQYDAGRPFTEFRIVNIDAITRWYWNLPGVDGFHRGMWWTPQHLTALTMFHVLWLLAVRARRPHSLAVAGIEGLLLAAAFATSSFNGVMLVGWYAATHTVGLALDRGRNIGPWLLARGTAAAIVLAVYALVSTLGMIQRIPNAFLIGWNQFFLRGPWTFLLLSFGPALFLAPFGLGAAARSSRRLIVSLATLVTVAAIAFLQVDLRGHENTQVTFRTGQLFYLCLAVLLGLAIDTWRRRRSRLVAALGFTALATGAVVAMPTVALDWYNARDIANREMNPGNFPWTLHISRDDQFGAEWLQKSTPPDAIVQTDALVRERNTWAFITAFAERRMGTGNGLFTLNPLRYEPNLRDIHAAFSTMTVEEAHATFTRIGVHYVYVGDVERRVNGDAVHKFHGRPELFSPLYRRGSVEIFRVN